MIANGVGGRFLALLEPIRNVEQAIAIDIASLLGEYIESFVTGRVPANFNNAALFIQASSSIYGKKVEYLHTLAENLIDVLRSGKENQTKKDTKHRERHREAKLVDPFMSTEIKPGKNLSNLSVKNIHKKTNTKKKTLPIKKSSVTKCLLIPADLLPLEKDEKGEVFYDTRGDPIGNTNDFAINKCRVIVSGWLLMPTISTSKLPTEESNLDYTLHNTYAAFDNFHVSDDEDEGVDAGTPFDMDPDLPSQPSSQGTDDGIGSSVPNSPDSTPPNSQPIEEAAMEEGDENIPVPLPDGQEDPDAVAPALTPRSQRQALQQCQLNDAEEEVRAVRKKIQKKNTCILPEKLKNPKKETVEDVTTFCARTFFSIDEKLLDSSGYNLSLQCFKNNPSAVRRHKDLLKFLKKAVDRRHRKPDNIELERLTLSFGNEDNDIDTNEVEQMQDAERDSDLGPGFDPPDYDMDINSDNEGRESQENPRGDVHPVDASPPNLDDLAADNDNPFKDFQHFIHTTKFSQEVHEWEQMVKPILEEFDHRERFDIDSYGSSILNSFENSNRKQTKTFQDFCKGMEKWQVHRYFMALLPLANMLNVDIQPEKDENNQEQINITLLSRKMHHKNLEEFGHSEGEHS